ETQTKKANFVVIAGQDIGRKYEVEKSSLSVGRNSDCDIFVDDDDVSRTHALINIKSEGVYISDLGSTNGTLVNGEKITTHLLQDGDRIQIGNLLVLKFNYVDEIEESFNEQLYNAANKDYLTQVYNKKYFIDRFKMEFSYSKRHESRLSLIVLDLDHFKQINDSYGHLAGDQILRKFAHEITAIKRHEDLFARFGGEEFVLLLRDTDTPDAFSIAEKIRSRIEKVRFQVDQKSIQVTVSIGLATFENQNFENFEQLLQNADQQLYRAKQSGRNKVCALEAPNLKKEVS
ncbi:MAG: GGDEF domain-containing protein, partial [Bdellovibrionales bacterium]|nr:GGDEF domain-containing protein [Bdellovibrionales bacterium]